MNDRHLRAKKRNTIILVTLGFISIALIVVSIIAMMPLTLTQFISVLGIIIGTVVFTAIHYLPDAPTVTP